MAVDPKGGFSTPGHSALPDAALVAMTSVDEKTAALADTLTHMFLTPPSSESPSSTTSSMRRIGKSSSSDSDDEFAVLRRTPGRKKCSFKVSSSGEGSSKSTKASRSKRCTATKALFGSAPSLTDPIAPNATVLFEKGKWNGVSTPPGHKEPVTNHAYGHLGESEITTIVHHIVAYSRSMPMAPTGDRVTDAWIQFRNALPTQPRILIKKGLHQVVDGYSHMTARVVYKGGSGKTFHLYCTPSSTSTVKPRWDLPPTR